MESKIGQSAKSLYFWSEVFEQIKLSREQYVRYYIETGTGFHFPCFCGESNF